MTMELDSKLLCLIRHGQGKHNPRADPRFLYHLAMVRDPELTALGERQAKALRARLRAEGHSFDAIVVSPLSRAIQTCDLLFGSGPAPIRLCPLLTERCCSGADVGTPKSELRERRPECSAWEGWDDADFGEQWWPTRTLSQAEYWPHARVQRLKDWLLARPGARLIRTPRGLRRVRTGYAYRPPALGTYRRRRAACPQGATYRTYWVRVPSVRTAHRGAPGRSYWLVITAGPERRLALVGHKGLMQCLTAGADLPSGHRLGNCEAFWVRLHADGRVCPLYATSSHPAIK